MCSRLLTMSRSSWQKLSVEFATRQKVAQEAEVSLELNGQMGSFSCQDQTVCNFFATSKKIQILFISARNEIIATPTSAGAQLAGTGRKSSGK